MHKLLIHSSSLSSSSLSSESNVSHDSSYAPVVFCHRAMACAVANANSLQRENIMELRPLCPPNDWMTSILRVSFIILSSSRMSSVAAETVMGSIFKRVGSSSARHNGHRLSFARDDNKHEVQNVCPQAVIDTFTFLISCRHMGHLSGSGSGSFSCSDSDGGVLVHMYCISYYTMLYCFH